MSFLISGAEFIDPSDANMSKGKKVPQLFMVKYFRLITSEVDPYFFPLTLDMDVPDS